MKKIVSILMAIVLLAGLNTAVHAEADTRSTTYPVIELSTVEKYQQHYINGESVNAMLYVLDVKLYTDYEKIIVYTDCNKDVIRCDYQDDEEQRHTETDTGYKTELDCTELETDSVATWFTYTVKSNGNPDVNIKIYGMTADGKTEELKTTINLPINKVYEKAEIPEIVTKLQPPAFGDSPSLSLSSSGHVFVCSPITVSGFTGMLSSSLDGGKIIYIPYNGTEQKNVADGDIFALEFEGRLCDFIQVFVLGDINSDGMVTSADARFVLRYSAQFHDDINISLKTCDVTHDGTINAADARMILRVAAKIDIFRLSDLKLWVNQQYRVGPLKSASDGGYLWKCTVSEEDAIEITEEIEPSDENKDGAPALQTFMLKPLKQGSFEVHFELIRPWENEPIEEFCVTVVVDGTLE